MSKWGGSAEVLVDNRVCFTDSGTASSSNLVGASVTSQLAMGVWERGGT